MGSKERKAIEKRIAKLEPYRLPIPTGPEQESTPIVDRWGTVVGQRGSLRKRFKAIRRGRPEEVRIKVRAAFEDKLAHPEMTWCEIAEHRGFTNTKDLERQVRLLKAVLAKEGIEIPLSTSYREAETIFSQ